MSKPSLNEWHAEGAVANPSRGTRPGTREQVVSFALVVRDQRGEEHFFRCECDAIDRLEEWEVGLVRGRWVHIRGHWLTRQFHKNVRGHELKTRSMEYCHVDEITFPEPPAREAPGKSPLENVA
jgi:hypothetical protein